jgi:hypothetical protein
VKVKRVREERRRKGREKEMRRRVNNRERRGENTVQCSAA